MWAAQVQGGSFEAPFIGRTHRVALNYWPKMKKQKYLLALISLGTLLEDFLVLECLAEAF